MKPSSAAHRAAPRFDIEMMIEIGFCKGIENYSRHLTGRQPGEPPPTLIDYIPRDAIMVIDESHVTVPQVGGMYKGDRVRKDNLVNYGFRLPSALDNRPLRLRGSKSAAPYILSCDRPTTRKRMPARSSSMSWHDGLVDLRCRAPHARRSRPLSEIKLRVDRPNECSSPRDQAHGEA